MARPSSHFLAQELVFWWLPLILLKIKAAFSFNAAVYLREMHYSPRSTLCCNTNILMTWHQALGGIRETKKIFLLYCTVPNFIGSTTALMWPLTCLECVSSLSERRHRSTSCSLLARPRLLLAPRSLRVQLPAVNLHRDAAEDARDQLTFGSLNSGGGAAGGGFCPRCDGTTGGLEAQGEQ